MAGTFHNDDFNCQTFSLLLSSRWTLQALLKIHWIRSQEPLLFLSHIEWEGRCYRVGTGGDSWVAKALTWFPISTGPFPLTRHHSLAGHLGGRLDDAVHNLIGRIICDIGWIISPHVPWTSGSWRMNQSQKEGKFTGLGQKEDSWVRVQVWVWPNQCSEIPLHGNHCDPRFLCSKFWSVINSCSEHSCHTLLVLVSAALYLPIP